MFAYPTLRQLHHSPSRPSFVHDDDILALLRHRQTARSLDLEKQTPQESFMIQRVDGAWPGLVQWLPITLRALPNPKVIVIVVSQRQHAADT